MSRETIHLQAAALWCSGLLFLFEGAPRSIPWLVNYAVDRDDVKLLRPLLRYLLCLHACTPSQHGLVLWHLGEADAWHGLRQGRHFRVPHFISCHAERPRSSPSQVLWQIEVPGRARERTRGLGQVTLQICFMSSRSWAKVFGSSSPIAWWRSWKV